MIGIDKIVIKSCTDSEKYKNGLIGVDYNKLKMLAQNNTNISLDVNTDYETVKNIYTDEYIKLKSLTIYNDALFNRFEIKSFKLYNNMYSTYYKLDLSTTNLTNNNLHSRSIGECKNLYLKALQQLENVYGIYLNKNYMLLNSIEINNTIQADESYSNYFYILNLMYNLAPANYEFKQIRDTLYLYNKSISNKLYDKTYELEAKIENFNTDEYKNMMRVELSLERNKILEQFKTVNLFDISDKEIKEYYINQVQKDLFKNADKHIKESQKIVDKLCKDAIKRATNNSKTSLKWILDFAWGVENATKKIKMKKGRFNKDYKFKEVHYLVDSTQVLEKIKEYNRTNYSKNIKKYQEELNRLNKYSNNFSRYEELKKKLLN
ncbi:TPA: hypothetical protein KNR75_003787 [Clostridioides difficile]|nr:hypothetical protein [Clostridioides difficile]